MIDTKKPAPTMSGKKRKINSDPLLNASKPKTLKSSEVKHTLTPIPESPIGLPSAKNKKTRNKNKPKISISDPQLAAEAPSSEPKSPRKKNKKKEATKPVDNGEGEIVVDEDLSEKYPILKNKELIERFLKVELSNNQKGRIRQAIKESLKGTSNSLAPAIIHNKIQSIIKSPELSDSDLRRVRILYNLLKTALKTAKEEKKAPKKPPKTDTQTDKDKPKQTQKVKGPKRYVVFLGNLPLGVNKEKIMEHFSEMNEHIKDIRLPKPVTGKKSAIAYLELTNEPSYEFALSKHHSMMGPRRINVLYSAPKNSKMSKADAKSKSAKMTALQRSGKLVGSLPLNKKRSQRRLKAKQAQAQAKPDVE